MSRSNQPPSVRCWWCGGAADSAEHKFKRSDLVRDFGRGAWTAPDDAVAHGDGAAATNVRSSRADRLKFRKVMCRNCNSTHSQPFDRAYDVFVEFLAANQQMVLDESCFKWSDVFGPSWEQGRAEVTRYWIKHIGTRLASDSQPVPSGLVAFLNRDPLPARHFNLGLELRADIVALSSHALTVHGDDFSASHWMGDLFTTGGSMPSFISHWGWRWLRLTYEVGESIVPGVTTFTSNLVLLPVDYNIDPTQIALACRECSGEAQPIS